MSKETAIKLFIDKQIRTHWDEENENGIFQLLMLLEYYLKVLIHNLIGES